VPYTGFVVAIDLHTRLALDSAARFRRVGDEGVVIQQTSAEVLVVNEIAARLIELSNGSRTIADCAGLIHADFGEDHDVIAQDLLKFAGELVAAGVAKIA
jgi:hypothetical protein